MYTRKHHTECHGRKESTLLLTHCLHIPIPQANLQMKTPGECKTGLTMPDPLRASLENTGQMLDSLGASLVFQVSLTLHLETEKTPTTKAYDIVSRRAHLPPSSLHVNLHASWPFLILLATKHECCKNIKKANAIHQHY